jgi:hypothetical protein
VDVDLLQRIERFLANMGVSPTRFGRTVVHDPRFVFDLRAGRRPRRQVHAKVESYLARHGA